MPPKSSHRAAQKSGPGVDRDLPWKEDGNIVISAQGKHFRVHRSMLSAHSEVFRDMFDCAHSSEAEKELVENCPVVILYDSAEDVRIMLNALYDRSFPVPCYEKIPLPVVTAFLHLGEKYAISMLVKEAKARLCCSFEKVSTYPDILPFSFKQNMFPAIAESDPHNFQILNLLQEMDLKAFLPRAVYHCIISCPFSDIVDGYNFNGKHFSLSIENLRSVMRIKNVIDDYRILLVKTLYTPKATKTCRDVNCLLNTRQVWWDEISAIRPFGVWISDWDKLFCATCREYLKTKRESVITKARNQIPKVFGFDSWQDAQKSDDFSSSSSLFVM